MSTIVEAVFAVFSAIADWFVEIIPVVTQLFYGESGLTFIGVLALIGLGISVVFLLFRTVSDFLHLRG